MSKRRRPRFALIDGGGEGETAPEGVLELVTEDGEGVEGPGFWEDTTTLLPRLGTAEVYPASETGRPWPPGLEPF